MKLGTTIRAASAMAIVLGVGFGFTAVAGADGTSSIWSQTHRQALFVETDASSGNTILSFTAAVNALPFAFVFDNAGNVVATEASNSSVSTYHVNSNGTLTNLGNSGTDGAKALCWISGANGYYYGSNAGSGTLSSFDENGSGAPQLVNATAATAHAGTTDSVVSPDGSFLYVESGGAGTIDAYAIGAGGTLTQIETIFNIPVASEGIAAS